MTAWLRCTAFVLLLATWSAGPAVAQLPPDAIPDVCESLDDVTVNTSTGTNWTLPDEDTPLLVQGADSARVYSPDLEHGVWVCKVEGGGTYVRAHIFGVYEVTDPVELAMMERVSADRTSAFSTVVYDHPVRYTAAQVISREDSVAGLRWADLPTDSLLWVR